MPAAFNIAQFKSEYDPKMCEKVYRVLARGDSIATACFELKISRSSFYRWREEHADFDLAVEIGLLGSQSHWEKVGKKIAREGGGNASVYALTMTNRFREDYKQRQDHEVGGVDGQPLEIQRTITFVKAGEAESDAGD